MSARNVYVRIGAVLFVLVAILNLAIGTYHTVLFAAGGSRSMFSSAYGIPVTAVDMADPARALGADAIEVYSILLAGYGLLSIGATVWMLRGHRSGFWINALFVGISQLAIVYGLIIPGQLGGLNGYLGPALYIVGVALSAMGLTVAGASAPAPPAPREQLAR
jgi:hypothetical protein